MQLETLKVFCDVITHHSFSQAAAANGITQSTASQSVHRLEAHMERSLIDRSVRPWRITDAGRRCFERSRDVLESYARLEQEMRQGDSSVAPEIRVGTIYSVGFCYMSQLTERFAEIHPSDRLHVEYLNPNVIIDRILDEELDLGIISFPSAARGVSVHPWRDEEMVVACSPAHPLAERGEIQVSALDGLTFACFDQDLRVGRRIETFLRERAVRRRVTLRFDNIEAIKRAVQSENTLAILPRSTLASELAARTLRAITFSDGNLNRPLGVVTRKGRCITPSMQRFLDTLGTPAVTAT
jgi:DNA-binding transcriptional LysR family regulator